MRATAVTDVSPTAAYLELGRPERIAEFLDGVLMAVLDLNPHTADGRSGRWLFRAEPHRRRIHWTLTQPVHASGTLLVHGSPARAMLTLDVDAMPDAWPPERVAAVVRNVVMHISRRLEAAHESPQKA